jgi:hypothetical protein
MERTVVGPPGLVCEVAEESSVCCVSGETVEENQATVERAGGREDASGKEGLGQPVKRDAGLTT